MKKESLISKLGLGMALAASAVGYSGCVNLGCQNEAINNRTGSAVQKMIEAEEKRNYEPTLDDFKKALGDRYIPEKEAELVEFWNGTDDSVELKMGNKSIEYNPREELVSIYGDLQESELYRTILTEEKDSYDKFVPSEKQIETNTKIFPWDLSLDQEISESNKVLLYLSKDFKYVEGPVLDGFSFDFELSK